MNKTATYLLALCAFFWCEACSWVDDDQSDCPTGCWLRLSYTYNMLDTDAAFTQVKDATVFIFDSGGNCVGKEEVDSITLHRQNCTISLPALPEGDYSLLVWAGLAAGNYQYTSESLTLLRDGSGKHSERLSPLFYGRLDNVHISDAYTVLTAPLTKNTNQLSCILQSQSADALNSEDFRLELTACNGRMDHYNNPNDTATVCYLPFMQEVTDLENIQVVYAGMNTLRIMENDNTRLRLVHVPGGKTLFDIPLTPYLLLSRNAYENILPAQEYLDRQDQYNLIFFLTSTGNPDTPYQCLLMQVNGWIIRLNNAELEQRASACFPAGFLQKEI